MTNKTITLLPCPFCGRELALHARKFNPYARCETGGCKGSRLPVLNLDMPDDIEAWNTRAALAAPVPPAGGDVEACCEVSDEKYNRVRFYRQTGDTTKPYHAPGEKLYDQACVTRLQAEVERLRADNKNYDRLLARSGLQRHDLQSELTKAREWLRNCTDCVRNGEDFDLPVTTMSGIDAFLSNQSAPVDKGQGEPVGLQHMAVAEDGKLRWMSGRKMQNCELYALPDGSAIRFPLYAEQPAPVAVVMPDFDTWYVKNRGVIGTAIYKNERKVWNACLDEVARLNSEPKP